MREKLREARGRARAERRSVLIWPVNALSPNRRDYRSALTAKQAICSTVRSSIPDKDKCHDHWAVFPISFRRPRRNDVF